MGDDAFRAKYLSFIQEVQKTLDDGKLPEALQALTTFYEIPNLPETPKREVEQLLDQLAGTVIYSRQNYLERPYVVQSGDTLDQIAERSGVPALLLARINGIDSQQLQPGQQLKVLRGPFIAVVSLEKHELMLKLQGGYYAGRFPIGLGTDCQKLEGSYTVLEKTPRPIYRGPDGTNFSADDGRNPLGKYWIGLNDRIGLHGTVDESGIGRDDNRGTICLKDRDIDDLNGILSVGSQVIIRR
jgi:LysM repeat protein